MNIKYRVISVDEKEYVFTVRFFTDHISEDELATTFDIDGDIVYNNGHPLHCRTDYLINYHKQEDLTQENLRRIIVTTAPIEWLKTRENLKANGSFFDLTSVYSILAKDDSFDEEEKDKYLIPISITSSNT